jgi:crossover junction endodeoxyribonuclease RusA
MIRITLPLPPTVNHYQRNASATQRYTTAEGKRFKQAAARIASQHRRGIPINARLALRAVLYFPDKRRCDLDNRVKPLQDALSAGMGFDDWQIDRLEVIRGEPDKQRPRCEVEIFVIEGVA